MGDDYQVVIAASAEKEIRRLPASAQRTVLAALDVLAAAPRSGKHLSGPLAGLWSLRRGDFRVLYRIDDARRIVEVARVGHRREVYRR